MPSESEKKDQTENGQQEESSHNEDTELFLDLIAEMRLE